MKEGKMIRNSLILVVIAAVLAVIFSPLFGSRAEAKTGKAGADNSSIQSITASKSSISFSYAGGTQTVSISGTKGNIRAERTSSASWASVAVSGRTVTISAPKNTGAARTGSIAIIDLATGQSIMIMVVQAGAPTPTPTPTPVGGSTRAVGSKGGTFTIQLPGKGPYLARTTATWLTVSISGSKATIKVAENKGAARMATVDFTSTSTGQTVRVAIHQSAAPTPTPTKKPTPTVTKAPTKAPTKTPTPTPAGGSKTTGPKGGTITIKLPGKGPYRVEKNVTWMSVSISGSTATITLAENKGAARTASLTFIDTSTGQTITYRITQSGAPTPTPTKKPTPTPTKKPTSTPTPMATTMR